MKQTVYKGQHMLSCHYKKVKKWKVPSQKQIDVVVQKTIETLDNSVLKQFPYNISYSCGDSSPHELIVYIYGTDDWDMCFDTLNSLEEEINKDVQLTTTGNWTISPSPRSLERTKEYYPEYYEEYLNMQNKEN